MTNPIPLLNIEPCEHPRTQVIGIGMQHCPDCTTFWTSPLIGVIPAPDNPPSDDACVCCGATEDLVLSYAVPITLWDKNRIAARLAGMPSIRKVPRCRECEHATPDHTVDYRCSAHGGRAMEFE